MPNIINRILVQVEEHATALQKKFPSLIGVAKTVASPAALVGTTWYVHTHPTNDQKILSDAKKHLDDNDHKYKIE
jgi:hypothetical protein